MERSSSRIIRLRPSLFLKLAFSIFLTRNFRRRGKRTALSRVQPRRLFLVRRSSVTRALFSRGTPKIVELVRGAGYSRPFIYIIRYFSSALTDASMRGMRRPMCNAISGRSRRFFLMEESELYTTSSIDYSQNVRRIGGLDENLNQNMFCLLLR